MATATQGSCAYARSCKLPVGNGASTQRHEFYLTLSETYKIAEGSFGAVYAVRSKFKDERSDEGDGTSKLIVVKLEAKGIKNPSLDHETSTYQRLLVHHLHSHYILGFYGEFEIPGHLGISLERAAMSLDGYRKAHQGVSYDSEKMRLAVETVEAVKWMHEQKIYHNDLKPAHILLDRGNRVKIADFGLASFDEPKPGTGTLLYMAPELLRYRSTVIALGEQRLSPQSRRSSLLLAKGTVTGDEKLDAGDVWGLGATILELFHGFNPCSHIHQKLGKVDCVLFALDLESDTPTWKDQPLIVKLVPFFDATLVARSARPGIAQGLEALHNLVAREDSRSSSTHCATPRPATASQPSQPKQLPPFHRPIPATAVAHHHLLGAQPRPSFTTARRIPQLVPSRLGIVSPLVASPSPPHAPGPKPPAPKPPSSLHDDQRVGQRASESGSVDSLIDDDEGTGSTEERAGESGSIPESAAPEVNEERGWDQDDYSDRGQEEESSEGALSPLAFRKPADVKGKGKARTPLTPVDNHLRPTQGSFEHPLPSSIPARLLHPNRPPASYISATATATAAAALPTSAPSLPPPRFNDKHWPLFDHRGLPIVYADCQPPPVSNRPLDLLYAILGDDKGLFAHVGDSYLVLTTSELEGMRILLEAYPEHATAEDEARLEVVLMQGDHKTVTTVVRNTDKVKYVCALCSYPEEFHATGFRKPACRRVAIKHVRGPRLAHGRHIGVILLREVGEAPFVEMREK